MATAINPNNISEEPKQEVASNSDHILAYQNGKDPYVIIGKPSNPFRYESWQAGIFVTQIQVWVNSEGIAAIKFGFSDGSTQTCGKIDAKNFGAISIDYESGERVTGLSIWTNGAGNSSGFKITTNHNQTFFPRGANDSCLKEEFMMNSGGGIIMGVLGYAGWVVEGLGFIMLDTVTDVVMTDLKYRIDDIMSPEETVLLEMTLENIEDHDVEGKEERKFTDEKAGKWSIKAGLEFGAEYKVKAGIPGIVDIEGKSHWKVSFDAEYEQSWKKTAEHTLTLPFIVPALSRVRIIYNYLHGTVNACPFNAKLKYYLKSGAIWTHEVSGDYDGVDTTKVVQKVFLLAKRDPVNNKWIELEEPQRVVIDHPAVKEIVA